MVRMSPILVLIALSAASAGGCDRGGNPAGERVDLPAVETARADAEPPPPPPLSPELEAIARLIAGGQNQTARTRLEAFVAQNPDDGQAAFLLGLTYHREKRYALAEPWFTAALRLEPGYYTTYHFLGWCLYYLGDMAGSRAAFERHLEFAPDEGDSHFALGLIALDEDRLDDAERRFRTAIELQRDNPGRRRDVSKAHARLADVYIRRDQVQEAKAELLLATELWPQHYTAFYKLSRVLNRLGENEAADEAFRQYKFWEERAEQRRGVPEQSP